MTDVDAKIVEIEKQAKDLEAAGQKLIDYLLQFVEQKGRIDGLKTSGTIDDDKAFKEAIKSVIKLMGEVMSWHIKLTMLHQSTMMLIAEEVAKQ